ncbi:MAG: phosphoribosylformylglycinamidine synthase subunit PurL [Planctomycetota bacterium]|nr:MAG: phosphoribosylformylglycinamidine synthase subunit PurL [Planctomycetota bacterium]
MFVRIEVALRPGFRDPRGESVAEHMRRAGLSGLKEVRTARVYHLGEIRALEGDVSPLEAAERLGRELFSDPVSEVFSVGGEPAVKGDGWEIVETAKLPGVMDPVEQSVRKAAEDLGYAIGKVRTSTRYYLRGASAERAAALAARVIANEIIERVTPGGIAEWEEQDPPPYRFEVVEVPILEAGDEELMRISREGTLSLELHEMRAIREYYRRKGRNPTDVELETLAQTWSEHCVHKTLKGIIEFDGEVIDNLLASTIAKATHELAKPWCVSVFKDNAGVIEFDDEYDVSFKVETHNHPSALEPYGGAGTGIGGVIRDTLGTGLGAKPILNTDVFCFGPPEMEEEEVPPGALHPGRVMEGVVAGVRDYGNRMGIPTANGAVYFDERYTGNPLVYCGNVGILPKGMTEKEARPGDLIVLLGGRTGRDGIHGATFSSVELTEESEKISSGAVQIGNAIEEKKLADAILQARDRRLFHAITDCGAGGLSSAVGEMGAECGARVNLEVVPLKYEGLSYTEIWISEAQERMVLAVPPESEEELRRICRRERVEMTVIGKFTDTGLLELFYRGVKVCSLDMEFLHGGLPRLHRKAAWSAPDRPEPRGPEREDFGRTLHAILASPNVASKEWIIRQYDHEVQGTSVLKPLVGVEHDGPGDAAVIAPRYGVNRGLVIACGMNPRYGDLDPYRMAASGIDEALRQVLAVGGDLERAALLDNFSWGDTKDPRQLGMLVLAARACRDYALLFGTPFISGKDSLNNFFVAGGKVITIPPTLLISVIAVLDDLRRVRSMDLKRAGNLVVAIGLTRREMGGSHYHLAHGLATGGEVPRVDKELAPAVFEAMGRVNRLGLLRSIHDMSEGGFAVAAAERAVAGGLGMEVELSAVPFEGEADPAALLFSESNTRFLAEVERERLGELREALGEVPHAVLGSVIEEPVLRVNYDGAPLLEEDIGSLKESWRSAFRAQV